MTARDLMAKAEHAAASARLFNVKRGFVLPRASGCRLRYPARGCTAQQMEHAYMTTTALGKVRSAALNLSEAERAELAYNLVVSLHGPLDADVEQAWDIEIMRRLAEIDSVAANLIDREEFRRRMRARMRRS